MPDARLPSDQSERPRLWVCHDCEMIGNQQEAHGHRMAHGHGVEELTAEESAEVRQMWLEDQARRVAGFRMAARGPGPHGLLGGP